MQSVLLTPPTAEPVTVAECKLALRIDDPAFDALLPGLIASARAVAEQETGRLFVEQTWRFELEDWPASDELLTIYRPTACSITYWNGSAFVSLSGSAYVYAAINNGTMLAPALLTDWPTLGEIAIGPRVRIDLTAGLATASASSTAACVKTFISALVGQLIQSPDLSATAAVESHPLLARLLDSQRLYS